MFLTINPDGRTFRHDSNPSPSEAASVAHASALWYTIGHPRNDGEPPAPIRVELAEGGFTLWVDSRTVVHGDGLRNIPASLLMAQYGTPVRLLAGTVVVTSSGSEASALVEDNRWADVESLVEDITRAIHGLRPRSVLCATTWAQAVRLAAAVLRDEAREPAPAGVDPYDHLMRDLTLGLAP